MLEIEKLDSLLTEAGIKHSFMVKEDRYKVWRTIWVPGEIPDLEKQMYSLIQHSTGSYGCEHGLIELWDLREKAPDLTPLFAEECFEIIAGDERIKAVPAPVNQPS